MATMDSFKRVRKKFLTCFRPLSSADDGSIKQKRHQTDGSSNNIDDDDINNTQKIVTYVSVHDQDNRMVLRKFLNSLSENNKLKVSSDGDDGAGSTKDKGRRAFSRAVKAVFFETSLAKKIRRRKHKKVSHASDSNRTATSIDDSNLKNPRPTEEQISGGSSGSWSSLTFSSSSSSSFSSITPSSSLFSSNAPSMPSTSRRFSEQNRSFHAGSGHSMQEEEEEDTMFPAHGVGKRCNSNFGLCLILLCLLVLMTWGRVFAVFCTSTCLFMIPSYVYRRGIVGVPGQQIVRLPGVDSAAHKKRVIMEGLLQRNRRLV